MDPLNHPPASLSISRSNNVSRPVIARSLPASWMMRSSSNGSKLVGMLRRLLAKRLMCFATHSMVIGLGATRCCSE